MYIYECVHLLVSVGIFLWVGMYEFCGCVLHVFKITYLYICSAQLMSDLILQLLIHFQIKSPYYELCSTDEHEEKPNNNASMH